MLALIVLLLAAWIFVAVRGIARQVRRRSGDLTLSGQKAGPGSQKPDLAARLVLIAVRLLPSERADWGQAMIGELEQIGGRRERVRFALGCLIATFLTPAGRSAAAGSVRPFLTVVLGATLSCVALVGFGLIRYPGVITGPSTWLALATFVGLLTGYLLLALVLTLRAADPGSLIRRAVVGGVLVCAACILVSITSQAPKLIPTMLLLGPLLVSIAIGVTAARRNRGPAGAARTAGLRVAMLSGVVAGLVLFILWTGVIVVGGGAPYDSGQVRDFTSSGAADLATYAVSDELGSALVLLILVPLMTATLGAAGAALTSRLLRHRTV